MASHNAASRAAGHKSSFSDHNGECVTVDIRDDHVLVWDSKDPRGPVLRFTPDEYVAFWKGVLSREFDPPAEWVESFDAMRASRVLLAGYEDAPVAVQGPGRWKLEDGQSLWELAVQLFDEESEQD